MPELSRFFGIIIRMFSEPSERTHVPHFHAYYQENVAVFSISPVEIVTGSMPQRQQRLIEAWVVATTAGTKITIPASASTIARFADELANSVQSNFVAVAAEPRVVG